MAKRSTLNVSLTPAQARFIAARVKSGRYLSASEVVREGIRLLQEEEQRRKEWAEQVREKLADGEVDLRQGRVATPEQFRARLAVHRASRTRKRAS